MTKDRIQSPDAAKTDASQPVELTESEMENVQGGFALGRKADRASDAAKRRPEDNYNETAKGIIDSIGR